MSRPPVASDAASAPQPAPPHRDPVLVGLAATALVGSAWLLWGPVPTVLSWLVQVGLDVVFVVASYRVAALGVQNGPLRRFWRGVTFAGVLFALGDGWQTVLTLRRPGPGFIGSTVQMVLVGLGVAWVVWLTLSHPIKATGRERMRLWLDAATVMSSVLVFAWTVSLPGGALPRTLDQALAAMLSATLMLASAFGLVKLVLSGTAPFTTLSALTAGVSAILVGVTTSAGTLLAELHDDRLVMLIRVLPCVLLAATPRIQERQMRRNPGALAGRVRRPYSRLPYLAIGATQVLLIGLLYNDGLTVRTWGVVIGVVGSTGLVVSRQLVAFTDNLRLVGRLDASMLELRRREERFRSLVQQASDITLVIDRKGGIGYASPALRRVLGIELPEEAPPDAMSLVHPDDRLPAGRMIASLLAEPDRTVTTQLRAGHADGTWRWLEVIATNLLDNPGVRGIVLNGRDVTDARQLQDQLQFKATHDNLTHLANRALFDERIRLAAQRGAVAGSTSVIAIDLDDFKIVNDTLGHHAGDALLVAVARRLESCVRPTDTVARLGGDEFAVLLPSATKAAAASVARRILAAFAEPVYADGVPLSIKASIGIAAGVGSDADALLREADLAMYEAKHKGKGRVVAA